MKAKRLLAFLCGAAVLQGIMLLFCTEAGLLALYPLLVRVSDEEYQTKGAYTVYYDMRMDVSDAPEVAVGIDFGVAQSYDAFQHLLRFIKQYRNVNVIYLDAYSEYAEAIAARMQDPMIDPGLPPVLLAFSDTLAAINETQPPVKKFSVHPIQERVYMDLPVDSVPLVLMDRDDMMGKRELMEETGILCVEMKYVNCENGNGVRQDIALPFAGEEVRYSFLAASRIEWFYRYFENTTGLLKKQAEELSPLEQLSAEYIICIANGTAADWGK